MYHNSLLYIPPNYLLGQFIQPPIISEIYYLRALKIILNQPSKCIISFVWRQPLTIYTGNNESIFINQFIYCVSITDL